jgi:hypothetical protein
VLRRSKTPRPNENTRYVEPVLKRVEHLRRAYGDAARENMAVSNDAVRQLIALLRDPATASAIDAELVRRRPRDELAGIVLDRELVKREAELGRSFGFKPREVKRYAKRARKASDASLGPEIASVADILKVVDAVHRDLSAALQAGGWWPKTLLEVHRARAEADARVFAIGVIVADTMRRPLFDLSYALGVIGLRGTAS